MKTARWTLLALAFQLTDVSAAPRFEDFPAAAVSSVHAPLHLRDRRSRQYSTQLREAARQPMNFSGHYVLATWGCGASCVMGGAVDLATGNVAWLPFTVCCWDLDITEPLEFRPDSRLLIVHGSLDEKGSGSDTHFFAFDGRRFRPAEPGR
ncbi:MAG: hypothetical protein ACXU8N_09735 [Telluria sp.]